MSSGGKRPVRTKRDPSDPRRPPYIGRRGEPEPHYDAIIIGAGIGGLVCGALLARAGLQVLLVEQHTIAGGYCTTFRRKGYVFDSATHFYPLLGNPDTMTGRLLAELGVATRWVKMDPVDQFHLPDGSAFSVSAELEQYLLTLKQAFPDEQKAIDRFFTEAQQLYYLGLLHYFRGRECQRLEPFRTLTLRDALDRHFESERLKLVLAADCGHWGSAPERTSYVFDSMLRISYFLGNYYPVGGSQIFADDLARCMESHGGQIMLHTMAHRIVTSGGRACGVEIETGPPKRRTRHTITADQIIANGDMLKVFDELLDTDLVDREARAALDDLRPTMPCYLCHIGMRDVSQELLEQIAGYHWGGWNPDEVGRGALTFKIFVPTLYEPRMAPDGGQVVILQRVTEVEFDAVSDWQAHKLALEEHALSNLRRLIPGFDDKVVVMSSASALTSYRFTLNSRGAMLGWEMSPEQLGSGRPEVEAPLPGLYFVGHWTRPGGGITPVIVSAMRVAELITGA
jgi:phytoene dehydrogenase-like protein